MYRVFNMGHRMELFVPETLAEKLIEIAASFKLEASVIGHVESSGTPQLTIISEHGKFVY
jgi:phosphoribosylformylglycinamidine cyclo-ligase